ncbi:MAG: TolB family protein [Candidatus Dormibacteria bacterium]
MRRLRFAAVLLVLWVAFGVGVNRFLESRRSALIASPVAVAPTQETPMFSLPGTIYISQAGHLYRFVGGRFTDMDLPTGRGSWTQPSPATPGRLLVVARAAEHSDIYLVDAQSGAIVSQLTSNASPNPARVELNAWSFWPHLAADGSTVIFDYDGPKTGTTFEVHLSVWSGPIAGRLESRQWTTPNPYTGGDVAPIPLAGGGVLYSQYALNGMSQIVSRIATVARPGAAPAHLTAATDDCGEPAVSPDGSRLAVICTSDTQTARLEVIPLLNGVPGAPRVLASGCLCASPAWAPDGSSLLYLAPADATGHFQLWWVNHADAPTPAAPKRVTSTLDFDATSPPAWVP